MELLATKTRIEDDLKVSFANSEVINLDSIFFPNQAPDLSQSFCSMEQNVISGNVIGSLGTLLFCDYQSTPVYLPIKKYVGYRAQLSFEPLDITLPAKQISLF